MSRTPLSCSLFSILFLGNAEYIGFSVTSRQFGAADALSPDKRRGGRFSVKCPGNREILVVLLVLFTVDSTQNIFFHTEYLPAITRFLYSLILKMKVCAAKSRRRRPQNRRNGFLEMIHSPRGGLWNMAASMAKDGRASFATLEHSEHSLELLGAG